MSIEDEWELLELEDEPWEDDGFGGTGLEEAGEYGSEVEAIARYEVGDIGELDEPEEYGELDEPWQADLGYEDGEGPSFELDDVSLEDLDEEGFFSFIKKIGRGLGGLIKKGVRALGKVVGPLLKKLGPVAARIVGGAIGGPAGAAIGGTIANAVLREGELETEADTEAEFAQNEAEFEELGGDRESFEAMQECAGEIAEAESERRADRAFIALARQAARMFRRNRRLKPAIPMVLRAALALVKTFRGNRRTRWAVRAIPLIIRRTLTRLARTRRIDRKAIVVAMSRETAWVLANRQRAMLAMRRGRMRRRAGRRRHHPAREELMAY